MTVDEVMEGILRDRMFYENSGGGVTLSGGEPFMQANFTLRLLRRCKEEDLHTAVDICGYTSWETLQRLLEHIDLFLYDIKGLDTTTNSKGTGKPNELIIENEKRIARPNKMWIGVPLVPGFNDTERDIKAILSFTKKEPGSNQFIL
jgi:pyruvate formate lyase activating enzyme